MHMSPNHLLVSILSIVDAAIAMTGVDQGRQDVNVMSSIISGDPEAPFVAKFALTPAKVAPELAMGDQTSSAKLAPAPAKPVVVATPAQPKAVSAGNDADKQAAKIELYYESRCPDCIEFLNMTLGPVWRNKELRAHYKISINPYGNAQSVPLSEISEGYKFWHPETAKKGFEMVHVCQHGTDECFGNLVQACAIKDEPQEKHMELVLCMAAHPNYGLEKSSYECMESLGIDKQKNEECVHGARGNHILAEFGKLTRAVKGRLGTPWVMINGENLKNPMHLTEGVCAIMGPNSLSTCKPFQVDPPAHKEVPEGNHDVDFQVFGKIEERVQKSIDHEARVMRRA